MKNEVNLILFFKEKKLLIILWLFFLIILASYHIYEEYKFVYKFALGEARESYNKYLLFRKWVASKGGVYVPITDDTPPNPYLDVPERDVETINGKKLTLMNPAYVIRQVFELDFKATGNVSKITSLKLLNPVNESDEWERDKLKKFNDKEDEFYEIVNLNNKKVLRYIGKLVVEKPCLKCHSKQGYKEGDVRGGISIIIPLDNYWKLFLNNMFGVIGVILSIFMLGLLFIYFNYEYSKETEERLSNTLNNTSTSLFEIKLFPKIQFLFFTKNIKDLTGYNSEELAGNLYKFLNFVHEDDKTKLLDTLNDISGKRKRLTYRFYKKDGTIIWLEHILIPIKKGEQVIGFEGTIHDISEQVRIEDEKTQLSLQLSHSQRIEALGQLAAGVAHDFNNALTGIIGNAELLKINKSKDNSDYILLENIIKSAMHSAELTKKLLVFSRKIKTEKKNLSLTKLLLEILEFSKSTIPENIEIKSGLCSEPLVIYANESDLHNVFINIIINAKDAMPLGGTLILTSEKFKLVNNEQEKYYAKVSITDTGVGMTEEIKQRIFEPFFTTKDYGKGTGLGLSTVYGIIHDLNGLVDVESEPNKGTTFRIYIPLAEEEIIEENFEDRFENIKAAKRILIVEDKKEVVDYLASVLEAHNYIVKVAYDGEEALNIFREEDGIDLIITDVMMPKMNGYELYKNIIQLQPDMKFIFITGYSDNILDKNFIDSEDVIILHKPFKPKELLNLINKVWATHA